MTKLEDAGLKAAAAMEALWKLDIFDPPIGSSHPRAHFCLTEIEKIIAENGWSWALPYRGDGPPQWCGMTAGAMWAAAGLDPAWLPDYFASTYRLMLWATYQRYDSQRGKQNPRPASGTEPSAHRLYVDLRRTAGITPHPGDIIIVGDGNPRWGDHVTVNMGYDSATETFDTISGNAGGYGPRGDHRQGVSRKSYKIGQGGWQSGYRPMFLIRPAESDLL